MSELRDDRSLGIGEVLRLSWPASLSMLNSTIMRFIDGLLVSFIGFVPLSAQMVAGLASFVPESFATGLLTVVNTYVAQNLGAKLLKRCGQYAWAGLLMAMAFCLLIFPLFFFAKPIFTYFNASQIREQQAIVAQAETVSVSAAGFADQQKQAADAREKLQQVYELRDLETMYFRYMVIATFLTLTARPLEQFFYGVHRPRTVLGASITANVVNLVLAYILVFGSSGLIAIDHYLGLDLQHSALGRLNIPKYGLEGSAWANLCSWGLYLVILFGMFLSRKFSETYGTRLARSVKLHEVLDLVRIGWPAGVQFFNDVLPWSLMLTWLVGHFGPVHLAATTAAMRWMPLSFMPAVGIGVATTALVGRYLGQRQPHLARQRAHAALLVALVYMGLCGLVFFFFREPLVRIFVTVTPGAAGASQAAEIVRLGGYVMICAAFFQLFDAIGIVFVGGLRGAGDTFVPMLYTLVLSWGLTVGGGYLMITFLPKLGSIGPWIAASVYIAMLGLAVARRFERGSWQSIDLLHRMPSVEPAEAGPLPPSMPPSPPSPPSSLCDDSDCPPPDKT